MPPAPGDRIVRLPRGGTIVRTSIGLVQFGAPPETIKDALAAGLEVPAIYVLPGLWFSRERGVTLAELEFPVYYNFFMQGRRVTAVCDADGRRRLMCILGESLLGPRKIDPEHDYAPTVPAAARADLASEVSWFRRKPGTDRLIGHDDVLAFALYDDAGSADLGGGVCVVRRRPGEAGPAWRLLEGERVIAEIDDMGPPPAPRLAQHLVPQSFQPPVFGVTVLGSSHGFDPAGKTTGFVLWVNRRGILVDPPCDASAVLAAAGVPPRTVDTVILTHCHADHDSGVFQKILEEGRVELFTTPTIVGSFLTKYEALTEEPDEKLRRLFVYRPVTLGAPLRIHGADFRFFYTLHSIPTIGFECYLGGKSFVYSSDTLYDPERIAEMQRAGCLSAERSAALLAFPWHHSLVIHEAGVPPIHTPAARLAELDDETKRRLRLIHIAEADLPLGAGLSLARTGFEHTLELPVARPRHAEALEELDALAAIELFRDLTVEHGRRFLTIARREQFPEGTLLIGQGEPGDCFYIVLSGEAAVVKDGAVIKRYRSGDFFGETALLTDTPRSADVRAQSALVVLTIDKYDFLSFLHGTGKVEALLRLAHNRDLPSWDLIAENMVLGDLSEAQRTQLQALLEARDVAVGAELWRAGGGNGDAWLVDSAGVDFEEGGRVVAHLGRGGFVGEVDAEVDVAGQRDAEGRPVARAVVTRAGRAFRLDAHGLAGYLENNPRVLLALSGTRFHA